MDDKVAWRLGKQTQTKTKDDRSSAADNSSDAALGHAQRTVAAARARGARAAGARQSSAGRSGRSHGGRVVGVGVGVGRDGNGLSAVGLDLERARGCIRGKERMVRFCVSRSSLSLV